MTTTGEGPMPEISVVVPTHDRAESLKPLLDALAGQTLAAHRFEVIVVDDCSTDTTADVLRAAEADGALPLHWFRTPSNSRGPARPRNLGWQSARASIVAFIDDDCVPDPEWLERGLEAMRADPTVGVLQAHTALPPGTDIRQLDRWVIWREVTGPTAWFEGTNIFYARAAVAEVGGFDESLEIWGEDSDLGWKVVEAGWRRGYTDRAVVTHALADRGWRGAVRSGWRDGQLVDVAGRHPAMRAQGFWRSWAITRQGAFFAIAIVGVTAATKWRPAIVLAAPYVRHHRPLFRHPDGIRLGAQTLVVDSARLAGRLRGSVKARILVV